MRALTPRPRPFVKGLVSCAGHPDRLRTGSDRPGGRIMITRRQFGVAQPIPGRRPVFGREPGCTRQAMTTSCTIEAGINGISIPPARASEPPLSRRAIGPQMLRAERRPIIRFIRSASTTRRCATPAIAAVLNGAECGPPRRAREFNPCQIRKCLSMPRIPRRPGSWCSGMAA